MKEGNINAEQSSDKRNDKSQEEDGAIKARAVIEEAVNNWARNLSCESPF